MSRWRQKSVLPGFGLSLGYTMEAFFLAEQGGYGTFSFVDPWDDIEYPDCSLENPDVYFDFTGFHDGRTRLVVRQNR